ncbi:MAG: helix-turn-helix domain-containing protein [Lachnospiraceae bacterium]
MNNVGNRIKKRRKELRLTQTDIYQQCGVDSGTLSKIENGSRTPSVVIFYKIAQALKCDMEWLMTGFSSNSQTSFICPKEETLLNGFRKISEEDQEELMYILEIKLRKRNP